MQHFLKKLKLFIMILGTNDYICLLNKLFITVLKKVLTYLLFTYICKHSIIAIIYFKKKGVEYLEMKSKKILFTLLNTNCYCMINLRWCLLNNCVNLF